MIQALIPTPKKLTVGKGTTALKNYKIVLSASCDYRVFKAAQKLASELSAETRTEIAVTRVLGEPALDGCINIIAGGCETNEGYTLSANGTSVTIRGNSLAGAFYGIQTMRQLVKDTLGTIPNVEIEDAPDMESRGFYEDISRGRVPTVESTKKVIDMLAYYKENAFQLYIEHTFLFDEYIGIARPENALTAAEIIELDQYCYDNFIDFVPSLSTFGHLYRLLESPRWSEYRELETYEPSGNKWYDAMIHHTIDPSNPESINIIGSMIDQYIPLFRSKYFNICCDETFDLGKGRNTGKDSGALYLEFTRKIIDHVMSRGKTVMMWGDIILHHPEILDSFPKDVVMLNWDYGNNPPVANAAKFRDAGYRQILCPGTSCWNQMSEVVNYAEQNIIKMIRSGHENGAMGSLNTAWGDYGHTAALNTSLYGVVLGAAISWNKDEDVPSKAFDDRVSYLLYGDKTGKAVQYLRELGDCCQVMNWAVLCVQYFGGSTWMQASSSPKDLVACANKALKLADKFRALPVQNEIIEDLILACEGEYLMCMSSARYHGGKKQTPAGFTEDWVKRYSAAWRRDNKESELYRIVDVFLNMK
ncbi:MAG: family 20 glycosylhydrolase [Clostridia bacterium]|nr:family 20 glycosylhydrolase [Clostridia bacterium]